MAAEPVKSPLHNFPLTFLKWGSKKDQQRCRRTPYDSPISPPPPPQSTAETSSSKHVGSRSSRNRRNNHPTTPTYDDVEERESGKKMEVAEEGEGDGDGDKGWNLRPRRAAAMKGSTTTTTSVTTMVETAGDKSTRFRGFETLNNGGGSEKREKKKFWIALSRDEIEEDIYSMTGHKPSRRPKKRPKIVQKQVDNVFPGLWLVGVTPEAYRGLDVPVKR